MASDNAVPNELLPLSPTVFHLLLALADGDKHGYAMMQAVEQDTGGKMRIRVGSLYGALQRMEQDGLIEESEERPAPELDDERRRYYHLTPHGRKVLTAEARRHAQVARLAKMKQVLDESF